MTFDMIQNLAGRGRAVALLAVVALACPACASKEKVAAGPAGAMNAGMAPPPMAAGYDPSRQMASGSSAMPWSSTGMPPSSAEGSSMTR